MQSISTCKSNGLTTWSSMPALPSASVVPGAAFSCVHFFPAGWSARYNATSLQYFCMTKGSVPSPCCRGESLATHRHTRRDHDLVRNRSTVEFVNLPGGRGRYEWLAWQQADAGGSLGSLAPTTVDGTTPWLQALSAVEGDLFIPSIQHLWLRLRVAPMSNVPAL